MRGEHREPRVLVPQFHALVHCGPPRSPHDGFGRHVCSSLGCHPAPVDFTARPDPTDLVHTFIPQCPLWLLVPAALVFSLVNASFEEAVYRGVLQGALDTARLTAPAVLILQAVAFAAPHFQAGFPRRIGGLGLTFVYGVLLGELRRRAGGLAAPFITHVLTDAVIVTIVLALVRT